MQRAPLALGRAAGGSAGERLSERRGGATPSRGHGDGGHQAALSREDAHKVREALAALPLFAVVDSGVLGDVASRASSLTLAEEEVPFLEDGAPLLVVLAGSLRVRLGSGPVAGLGPGAVLNAVGALGLRRAGGPYRPGGKADGAAAPPAPATDASGDDACIRLLCPHAALQLTAGSCALGHQAGWLRFIVEAAPGGARLAAVGPELLVAHFSGSGASSAPFRAKREALASMWTSLVSSFVFPGCPHDVSWALAEVALRQHFPAGQHIFIEGTANDTSGSLMIIEGGDAVVEKLLYEEKDAEDAFYAHAQVANSCDGDLSVLSARKGVVSDGFTATRVVGKLGPGAVFGDACFLGVAVPRMATVTAKTHMQVLTLPTKGVLSVMKRFPGLTKSFRGRLSDVGVDLQQSLPVKVGVLRTLQIFSDCGCDFLRDVANIMERQKFYCGEVAVEASSSANALSLIEFGICHVEGDESEYTWGSSFGEGALLGQASEQATVRAVTPLVLLLVVPAQPLRAILARFPMEQNRIEQSFASLRLGGNRSGDLSAVAVFRSCGRKFVRALESAMEKRCYMPGQTIVVEGALDEGSMYVITGGRASLEVGGNIVAEFPPGTSFGDYATLGIVRRRTATVRALSCCFVDEVPRASFLHALDQHPEEREHVASLITKYGAHTASVKWRILDDHFTASENEQLFYHVTLNCERRITPEGAWTSRKGEPLETEAAILVMQGVISVQDDAGQEMTELWEGDCCNEQVLLGLPRIGHFVPKSVCEVQIMPKGVFDNIMAELGPAVAARVQHKIVEEMAQKAQRRLGYLRGSPDVLKLSAMFRSVPSIFVAKVHSGLVARMYSPGETIIVQGVPGDAIFFLLEGVAVVDSSGRIGGEEAEDVPPLADPRAKWNQAAERLELQPGCAFGEASMLEVCACQPATIWAASHCLLWVLPKAHFLGALHDCYEAQQALAELRSEQSRKLRAHLHSNSDLKEVGPDFARVACRCADDVFVAPGGQVIRRGERNQMGRSHMYVLISGRCVVEGEYGVRIGEVGPGAVIGEGGALGITKLRCATVRAWTTGIVHCARLQGAPIREAAMMHPDQFQALVQMYQARRTENDELVKKRGRWLESTVIPTIANHQIFSTFSAALLSEVVRTLEAVKYCPGQVICSAGDRADSLLFLITGVADVVDAVGEETVGRLSQGGVLGDINIMGLCETRTATLRAASECQVFAVPSRVLQDALARPEADAALQQFRRLRRERKQQAATGLPLCALPLKLSAADRCVRAVALHAEKIEMAAGDVWTPLPDDCPCGPHFGVLIKGRARLEIGGEGEAREVMQLHPGDCFPEGLASEFGARVRASAACEAYRVRLTDFQLAVRVDPSSAQWSEAFRRLGRSAWVEMRLRLEHGRAAVASARAHAKFAAALVATTGSPVLPVLRHAAANLPPQGSDALREAGGKLPRVQSASPAAPAGPAASAASPTARTGKEVMLPLLQRSASQCAVRQGTKETDEKTRRLLDAYCVHFDPLPFGGGRLRSKAEASPRRA